MLSSVRRVDVRAARVRGLGIYGPRRTVALELREKERVNELIRCQAKEESVRVVEGRAGGSELAFLFSEIL